MALIVMMLFGIAIFLTATFAGMVYYKNRKSEYAIARIDFPKGLSASGKYECIQCFIRTKKIKEIRGIYMRGKERNTEYNLKDATFVYLDYVL